MIDPCEQYRDYQPDDRLTHRDAARISAERKICLLRERGWSPAAIALDLKLPVGAIEAIVQRNTPAAPKVRRGS